MAPHHAITTPIGVYDSAPRPTPGKNIFVLCLFLVAGCILAGQCFLFYHHVPRVISDGYGYWSYLPSYIILDDPSFAAFAAKYAGTPLAQGLLRTREGTFIQKYAVGVALLQAPFFLAADSIARQGGWQRDGYSLPYQIAAALAPAVYALCGLGLLMAALRPFYSAGALSLTTFFLFFGTNAYHYATFDGSFSHIFSFFLAAALLYVLLRHRQKHLRLGLFLGCILGTLVLVRPTNALYILFTGIWLFLDRVRQSGRTGLLLATKEMGICCVIVGALFCIQLQAWHAASGKWFLYPYDGEYFEFLSPHPWSFLFSVRKGGFFWHPLYCIAIVGLFFIRRPREYFPAATLFLTVFIYVSSSWYCWWYGGTLGQRVFVDIIPILFPGISALLSIKKQKIKYILTTLFFFLMLYSFFCTLLYWIGVIPSDEAKINHIAFGYKLTKSWLLYNIKNIF